MEGGVTSFLTELVVALQRVEERATAIEAENDRLRDEILAMERRLNTSISRVSSQ
jgi:hypothetical protein